MTKQEENSEKSPPENVQSVVKGNSKVSPSKGKGLVKGSNKQRNQRGAVGQTSKSGAPTNLHQGCKLSDLVVNPALKQENLMNSLRDAWENRKEVSLNEEKRRLKVEMTHDPFTAGRFFHLLQSTEFDDLSFCDKLTDELRNLKFLKKNNDLYQFHQTPDLKSLPPSPKRHPYLDMVKSILCKDVKEVIEHVTNIQLTDEVDLFCGRYTHTDYLLCHDDELEGRRIAFIYYAVPPSWCASDGGSLDLFATNWRGEPSQVAKSLAPRQNSFAFFEVSPKSFHQVAEVLSKDKVRLSISGWFHGLPAQRPPRYPDIAPPLLPWIPSLDDLNTQHQTILETPIGQECADDAADAVNEPKKDAKKSALFEWVSPMFLDPELAKTVRKKFGKKSEIQLEDFIASDKMASVFEALHGKSPHLNWQPAGPTNKRRYQTASTPSASPLLHELISVFRSEEMFFLLSHLTGLNLHPFTQEDYEEEEESESGESQSEGEGESEGESEMEQEDEIDAIIENPINTEDRNSEEIETKSKIKQSQQMKTDFEKDRDEPLRKRRKENTDQDDIDADVNKDSLVSQSSVEQSLVSQSDITSAYLSISPLPPAAPPKCSVEVRQWKPGCYSLLGDMSKSLETRSVLDVMLFCGVPDNWDSEQNGGASVYVAKDEEEELMTICPKHAALALVYREKDTSRFTKYINSTAPNTFYELSFVYVEGED